MKQGTANISLLLFSIGWFFAASAIFMVSWNYVAPRLYGSVITGYDPENALGISYSAAMLTTFMIYFFLHGSSHNYIFVFGKDSVVGGVSRASQDSD